MADPVFAGINHICIATRDIDRAVRVWADKYGIGPWRVYTYDASNSATSVDGTDVGFAMRAGLCQFGPTTRVEIIQPLDDLSPYAQSLEERGGADHIHHIRVDVGDHDRAFEHLEGLDIDKLMVGRFQGADPAMRSLATYWATDDDLGFTLELSQMPPGFSMPEPDYIYPDG